MIETIVSDKTCTEDILKTDSKDDGENIGDEEEDFDEEEDELIVDEDTETVLGEEKATSPMAES